MPNPPLLSQLDSNQVLKAAFDDATHTLRTNAVVVSAAQEVIISHTDDSIRLGDGTNLFTGSVVGVKKGLDIYIIGGLVTGAGLKDGIDNQAILVTDVLTPIPLTSLVDAKVISVRVWGASTVYFGKSGTTTIVNGYPKMRLEEIILDTTDATPVRLYGICAPGESCDVRIIQIA